MINSYCDSLGGFFGQMVFFGLLKEEDAQCFSVQSAIEDGAFVLAAGAVLLALLNTFVTKAVTQYIGEKTQLEKQMEEEYCNEEIEDEEDECNDSANSGGIHPVPVLFTDTFRWLLRGDDRVISSCQSFEVQNDIPNETMGERSSYGNGSCSDSSHENSVADGSADANIVSVPLDQDDEAGVQAYVGTNMCDLLVLSNRAAVPRHSISLNNRPDKGDVGVV
jgi:hypothetical protein